MSRPSDAGVSLETACRRLLSGRSREELLFCRRGLASHPVLNPRLTTPRPQRGVTQLPHLPILLLVVVVCVPFLHPIWVYLRRSLGANPCLIPNNFALMEATRPISHCDICAGELPVRLVRPSRAQFAAHAYRGRPVLVSGATETWPARRKVDLPFLRRLYARVSANASVAEDGCQFLAFRSPLESLEEVLEGTVDAVAGGPPWYIGW